MASLVKGLGYYMPSASTLANNEDATLRALLKRGDVEAIKRELDDRAAKHSLVAWKDPKLFGKIGYALLEKLDPEWSYLIVLRDPLSVAMRNSLSLDIKMDVALLLAATNQLKLVRFYLQAKERRIVHLVSYEKFITDFEKSAEGVLSALGFSYEAEDLVSLQKFVSTDHERYRAVNPGGLLPSAAA